MRNVNRHPKTGAGATGAAAAALAAFVALYGPDSRRDNVLRVRFDAEPAMAQLGAFLGEWVTAAPGRVVYAFVLEGDEVWREEFRRLEQEYLAVSAIPLESEHFPSLPDQDGNRLSTQLTQDETEANPPA